MAQFVLDNYEVIVGIIGGILIVAAGITKLTKTPKDDEVVSRISVIFGKLKSLKGSDGSTPKAP